MTLERKILSLILLALMILGAYLFYRHYQKLKDDLRDATATIQQQNRTDKAAGEIAGQVTEATGKVAETEAAVNETRVTFHHVYEEQKRADPTVAQFDATPIPERLRQLARQRREERERLGSPGAGRPGADEAKGGQR